MSQITINSTDALEPTTRGNLNTMFTEVYGYLAKLTLGASSLISLAASKTFTINNTITLSATDGNTYTLPTPASGTSENVVGRTSTDTMTNKRVTRRVTTANAPGATPTMNTDNADVYNFTGLAAAITSMTTNLSGTPVNGDFLEIRFTDNGTARAITWGASFEATTVALPTTTVTSAMLRVLFEWNSTASKWDCIATA